MCANALLPIARDACCDNPQWERPGAYSNCYHSYERTTFQTAKNRCDEVSGTQCPWFWIDTEEYTSCQYYSEDAWYWTSDQICSLQAKGKKHNDKHHVASTRFHFIKIIYTTNVNGKLQYHNS